MRKRLFSILAGFVVSLTLCACGTPKVDNHSGERFEVTFKNYDASILFYTSVEYGETAVYQGETPTRPTTDDNRYDFSGWDKPLENIRQDTTFIAQYNELPNKFTVNWVVDNKNTSEQYHYGETPYFKGDLSKPSTVEYEYQFNRWEPAITPVIEDITYTAIFDESYAIYQVRWLNYDRTVLDVEYYEYGSIATYKHENPTRPSTAQYSYTFIGWGLGSKVVDGNKEFIAEYSETLNQYTITWANWNGSTLQTETYDYGSTPSYKGETPTKPNGNGYKYTFSGWSPTITTVTKDAAYTATFTSTYISDINYGTEQEPLTISQLLTEVAKLELTNKSYSPQYFFVKATLKGTITGNADGGHKFKLTDGEKDMDVSSAQVEEGKTATDYANGDIITLRAYARADSSKTNGYYFSYNLGGESGKNAPQIIASEKGQGGETVPEPSVTNCTLAEFIANTEGNYKKAFHFSAQVKSVTGDQYGNMYLTDGTNDLRVYGSTATTNALAWNDADAYIFNNPKDFLTNTTTNVIQAGDTVEVKFVRCDYNTTI